MPLLMCEHATIMCEHATYRVTHDAWMELLNGWFNADWNFYDTAPKLAVNSTRYIIQCSIFTLQIDDNEIS